MNWNQGAYTGLPFLQILTNTFLLSLWWQPSNMYEVVSHCGFDLHVPDDYWWTCWPFLCSLGENVCSDSQPTFQQVVPLFCFVFCYWVVWILSAFWILTPYRIHDLKIFSLHRLSSFCWAENVWFDIVPLVYACFLLVLSLLLVSN